MRADYIRELFEYNDWAHRRVWDCIMELSDEQFNQHLDYSIGAIRKQVLHTIAVERAYFLFLTTGNWGNPLPRDLTDRYEIRALWDAFNGEAQAYLMHLTDEELDREVDYQFVGQPPRRSQVWEMLMQVYSHSLDHRAQTLAMLHRLGAPTVMQDFIQFVWSLPRNIPT